MMLFLVTSIVLLGFTFMQITMIVRRIDIALYTMIPGVFEAGVDTEYALTHDRVVFDKEALHQYVTTYLTFHFSDVPLTYAWELTFEDARSRLPCTSLCDGAVFHFDGAILDVYTLERTFEMYIMDHENHHD